MVTWGRGESGHVSWSDHMTSHVAGPLGHVFRSFGHVTFACNSALDKLGGMSGTRIMRFRTLWKIRTRLGVGHGGSLRGRGLR